MNSINFIKMSLGMSQGWIMGLLQDMADAPLTAPTPNGGNHPLWCIGHLAFSEGHLVGEFVKGGTNPLDEWKELFGVGSEPTSDASAYPTIEEVVSKFELVRAETLAHLDTLTDDDLDSPSHAPDDMKDLMGTIGQCFAAITIHFGFHGGQIADARRAAGRVPMMA